MTATRPSKPLYEVLTEERQPTETSRAEMAELHGDVAPAYSAGTPVLRVPMSTVYVAAALVIGLVLLAWVGGHAVGFRAGEAEIAKGLTPGTVGDLVLTEPAPRREPAQDSTARDQTARPTPAVTRDPTPIRQPVLTDTQTPTPAPTLAPETGTIISPRGLLSDDPRTPGVNYLALATLNEASAADAVQFLASKGLETIAVPISAGSTRYSLISLGLPVPGGRDYGRLAPERRAHERLVAQLGSEWLRQHRGASDFSQPLWSKYEP